MIEISNLTRQKISDDLVIKVVEKVLAGERAGGWDISIVFVGCAKIRELNKKFRNIDNPTDVLSFANLETKGSKNKIGEIFVCPKMIAKNDMPWAIAHSVLHLLGYTHEGSKKDMEKMRQKELVYS
ncbi:MAG: rRNA maturation RNase YbeY [bacterium]|nr:rRNA maturation RNase YbeY [bacterium]